jgi:uncharacterized membrane-anchored protein YitT (DUF2179 family)
MIKNRFHGLLKKKFTPSLGVLLGSLIMAAGMNLFLIPHRLAAGGISGLGVIFFHLFRIPAGLTITVLNLPLFIAAWFILGPGAVIRSLLGTFFFPLAIELTAPYLPAATQDPLLAAVYGGMIMGLGLGLVFRCHGSTGGTALLSLILNRTTGLTAGQGLLGGDLAVIGLAVFVFGGEAAMYAALSLFVSTRVIDLLQEGLSPAKAVLIITVRAEEINRRLLRDLGRGVTRLTGRGGYTGEEREVLLCVVTRPQVARLKELIYELDPAAFVIIGNAGEVHGEGFREMKGSH